MLRDEMELYYCVLFMKNIFCNVRKKRENLFAMWKRRERNLSIHYPCIHFCQMIYETKLRLIVLSSKLPAITISGSQRTKSCYITLSLVMGESISGPIKNIIKRS